MTGTAAAQNSAAPSRFARFKARHRKTFIVDVDGALLRRHELLSKGARRLYGTMRALADGKTGKLVINGHSLDWRYIARETEVGRDCWRMWFKELVAAGLAGCDRPRSTIPTGQDGQRRNVLGRATYFIHRQAIAPKNVKNPRILLRPDFPTVEESGAQSSQTHQGDGVRSVFSGCGSESISGSERQNHHHSAHDDDSRSRDVPHQATSQPTPERQYAARLQGFVKTTLAKWERRIGREVLENEIARIIERSGHAIVSANYLDRAIENFLVDGGGQRRAGPRRNNGVNSGRPIDHSHELVIDNSPDLPDAESVVKRNEASGDDGGSRRRGRPWLNAVHSGRPIDTSHMQVIDNSPDVNEERLTEEQYAELLRALSRAGTNR